MLGNYWTKILHSPWWNINFLFLLNIQHYFRSYLYTFGNFPATFILMNSCNFKNCSATFHILPLQFLPDKRHKRYSNNTIYSFLFSQRKWKFSIILMNFLLLFFFFNFFFINSQFQKEFYLYYFVRNQSTWRNEDEEERSKVSEKPLLRIMTESRSKIPFNRLQNCTWWNLCFKLVENKQKILNFIIIGKHPLCIYVFMYLL